MQEALFTLTHGLYVVGSCNKPHFSGAIVDSVAQVSANPPLIMLSMMNHSHTKSCIDKNLEFSLSVLPEDIDPFVVANFGFQSGHNIKKWEQVDYVTINGLPYIPNALAKLKAKVIDTLKYHHNTIYIAEIKNTYDLKEGAPLTYKHYREHLKPICHMSSKSKASCELKTAPHEKGVKILDIHKTWTCSLCYYEYKEDIPFEELDDNWRCPLCGVGKDMFELR